MVDVQWARQGRGFTLLLEALILAMAQHMPMAAVARLVGEHDTRLWRVVQHYVDTARAYSDDSEVRHVGIDEKEERSGHDYISLFVNLDGPRVLFATEGRDSETVAEFARDLKEHGGDAEGITEACADMSPAFIKGIGESLTNAAIAFDKFHLKKIITEAVDKTRRQERDEYPELKGMRYALLRNEETMTDNQLEFVSSLLLRKYKMKTASAFHLKLAFDDLYTARSPRAARRYLTRWCNWAVGSRVLAMVDDAKTIRRHFEGILWWFTSKINNGILEEINSLIQAAKAKARGYRSTRNLERLPPIRVNASSAEGVVDAAGELCCGSVNRLFRTDLALLAAVEGSQLRVRIRQRLSSDTQSGGGQIGCSPASRADHPSPNDVRSRR